MSDARSRARSLRERAEKAAEADSEAAEKAEAKTRPTGNRKVRQTVDLREDKHQGLAAWRLDTTLALGRTRLTTQDVLRAAVDVLLTDDAMARRVRLRLEEILDEEAR